MSARCPGCIRCERSLSRESAAEAVRPPDRLPKFGAGVTDVTFSGACAATKDQHATTHTGSSPRRSPCGLDWLSRWRSEEHLVFQHPRHVFISRGGLDDHGRLRLSRTTHDLGFGPVAEL